MTLFLCLIIFIQLSIPDNLSNPDGSNTTLGTLFYYLNYFLLCFFVTEISLKVFSQGQDFLGEFINVFDSIIVFISFYFQISGTTYKFIGILRILRLIKVMMEMKRVADAKKIRLEAIKKQKK